MTASTNRRAIVGSLLLIVTVGGVYLLGRGRDARRASAVAATQTPGSTTDSAMAGMPGIHMPGMDMPGMDMPGMDMSGMNMSGDGNAVLDSAQIAQFGVTFARVEQRELMGELRVTGSVVVAEPRVTQVALKVSGFAEQLHVAATGGLVQRGQPLLELYSAELVSAQQELLVARDLARRGASSVAGLPDSGIDLVAAARYRLRLLDVSDAQLDDVLRSGTVPRAITIVSPSTGYVTAKYIVRGQRLDAGMPLYTITDLREVWVEAAIREADGGSVTVGTRAEIDVPALPGRAVNGRVIQLDPMLDSASRSLRARIAVANTNGLLRPGMSATVRLAITSRRTVAVPTAAIVRTGSRDLVFVNMGRGQLMPHEVSRGAVMGEFTEILSGVEPGMRVVTSAQFLIESEANIGDVMRAMIGQMGTMTMSKQDMPMPIVPPSKRAPSKP